MSSVFSARSATRLLLISDFNVENLCNRFLADASDPAVTATAAPFGDVRQTLLDGSASVWRSDFDAALIWTQPHTALSAFQKVMSHQTDFAELALDEVDDYVDALLRIRDRVPLVLVANWALPSYRRGLGLLDVRPGGCAYELARINQRLVEGLRDASSYYVLDAARWIAAEGESAYDDKLWYLTKTPFHPRVFDRAVGEVKAALRAIQGKSRKLIILDLDDTLWGGVVGECGWQKLRLGGHDPLGEAFVAFQRELKALQNRGVLLALASKNEESVALEAIERHPQMVLRREDFVAWRINWRDKAENIQELVSEINLSLDAAVFIDDNPAERNRVQESLPEVLVPDWPREKAKYAGALLSMDCFDSAALSEEDRRRTEMYAAERRRKEVKTTVKTVQDWLKTLNTQVRIERLDEGNLMRAAQLLNKTNQMNLSTRRMAADALWRWAKHPRRCVWCFSVSDRFGDSGLVGLASAETDGRRVEMVDFVLSCRVFGRQIEKVMVHTVIEHAQYVGAGEVAAVYKPTPKNKVCFEFWNNSGFQSLGCEKDEKVGEGITCLFQWPAAGSYPLPDFVSICTTGHRQAA